MSDFAHEDSRCWSVPIPRRTPMAYNLHSYFKIENHDRFSLQVRGTILRKTIRAKNSTLVVHRATKSFCPSGRHRRQWQLDAERYCYHDWAWLFSQVGLNASSRLRAYLSEDETPGKKSFYLRFVFPFWLQEYLFLRFIFLPYYPAFRLAGRDSLIAVWFYSKSLRRLAGLSRHFSPIKHWVLLGRIGRQNWVKIHTKLGCLCVSTRSLSIVRNTLHNI